MHPLSCLLCTVTACMVLADASSRGRFAIVNLSSQPMIDVKMTIRESKGPPEKFSSPTTLGTLAPGQRIEPRLPQEQVLELVQVEYRVGDEIRSSGCGPVGDNEAVTLTIEAELGSSCAFAPLDSAP